MTGSFGYPGWGTQPHDEASSREHLKEVEEDIRHDRAADDFAKSHPKRAWWKFWGTRTG